MNTTEPSICIPRVFTNIDELRIKNVFCELFGINNIKQIDVIKKFDKRNNPYNKVFVHFNSWPIEHIDTRKKLLQGKDVKIVYEQPWFWKCSASRIKKFNKPPYVLHEEGNINLTLPPFNILSNSEMLHMPYNTITTGNDVKTIKWNTSHKNSIKQKLTNDVK